MDLRFTKFSNKQFSSKIIGPCSSFLNQIVLLFLSLIIISCSASSTSLYESNFPLTNEIAKSKNTELSVKIPTGWFTADDNECNCIDLWLIKDDYSATLNFSLLNFDKATLNEIQSNELSGAAEYSKTFKKIKYGKSFKGFSNEETFHVNGKSFVSYEYADDQMRNIRVVVFKWGEKFYELSAIPAKKQNLSELYKIQNSVISSINY